MEAVDNLYKHMTIWGVLLMLFSLAYPFSQVHKFNLDAFEIQALATLDMQLQERLQEQRQEIIGQAEDPESASCREQLARIDEELLLITAQIESRIDRADYQLYVISLYTKFGIAGALIGLISALLGFRLWYVRVQKPQDIRWHELHHDSSA